jgi:hypothetical protein
VKSRLQTIDHKKERTFQMAVGYFLDKTHEPTKEEILAVLGASGPLWQDLLDFIETSFAIPGIFSCAGPKYGWNLWYKKGGKALTTLFPQKDYFVAQVVLGRDQVEKALTLELGDKVGRLLRETPQFHDGRWLFIPVSDQVDMLDVEKLLLLKRKPIKK